MISARLLALVRRTALGAALAALASPALAQGAGRVAGTVTSENGTPLASAQVSVEGTRVATTTNEAGRYTLANVPAGTRVVRVVRIGYKGALQQVEVRAGEEAAAAFTLAPAAVQLGGVVVSAGRQPQKITDAPATVTRVEADRIANSAGNSFAAVLREVKGVDVIQTGMTSVSINARGFNSSFNNRMLMMEDGRIAVLPENGLPVGSLTAIPKVDLAGVEVLVGPGAALYGADASNGVLTLQTKDPREYPGTTVEVSGGSRGFQDVQFRHAAVNGSLGYKLSGEWLAANDFDNELCYARNASTGGCTVPEVGIDWRTTTARASGAVVYYRGAQRLEFNAGASQFNGVGQTNVGRNQLKDWVYNTQQLKYLRPNWYLNAYRTQSLSGESYAVNRYSSAKVVMASQNLSDDSLKKLSDWPADGRLYAAELQNNFTLPALLGTRVVWGGQVRHDRVSSKREWLDDRLTGEDLTMTQRGVYAQAETPLTAMFSTIVAGRVDKHSDYATQYSPKAGLLFKPTSDQTLRVTWNRAFKSPTTLQNRFNIADFTTNAALGRIGVFGNRRGFTVRDAAGATVAEIDPIVPERNTTVELGYKGILAQRLFLDVTGYRATYEDFMTPLLIINRASGATPTYAYQGDDTRRVENANGQPQTVLTYRNLGQATLDGMDAGVRWVFTPRVAFGGTASVIKAREIEVPTSFAGAPFFSAANRREIRALNSAGTKWRAGFDFTDLFDALGASVAARHTGEYFFASGINVGWIPSYSSLDASVNYKLRSLPASINLAVNNLFSCAGRTTWTQAAAATATTPARAESFERSRECGMKVKHVEMINMPAVGQMVFLGVRYGR